MKIIVTHEQADFDAVASQLAASLLEPAAIPILPKRINRNVASFLKDFSYNFNFRTDAEIAEETVDSVLVVDTQAISNTAKIKSDTEVSVIDHHQPRLNLPENGSVFLTGPDPVQRFWWSNLKINRSQSMKFKP